MVFKVHDNSFKVKPIRDIAIQSAKYHGQLVNLGHSGCNGAYHDKAGTERVPLITAPRPDKLGLSKIIMARKIILGYVTVPIGPIAVKSQLCLQSFKFATII